MYNFALALYNEIPFGNVNYVKLWVKIITGWRANEEYKNTVVCFIHNGITADGMRCAKECRL